MAYAVWWALSLVAVTALVSLRAAHPPTPSLTAGPLEDKLSFYELHKSEFNLILLGDSLTYTGLHPEFIDPELGTRSINMATFAHWFATQYPYIQDLIHKIPRGTRVLWSVHLYDFEDGLSIQHVYPVGLKNAVRYWAWGARNPGLADNVLYYNPLSHFFVGRAELRSRVIARGEIPVSVPRLFSPAFAAPEFPTTPAFAASARALADTPEARSRLIEYYARIPFVAGTMPISDHGQINSVILYLKKGGYFRIELTPGYFREKQREMAKTQWHLPDREAEAFQPRLTAPVSVKMFEAGLSAFRAAGIPVTINLMEEAPFVFPNEIVRKKYRRMLDQMVRAMTARYGDDFVHVDYSSFVDSDYFDYNHFNSTGIAKYTPMLIHELGHLPEFAHRSGN